MSTRAQICIKRDTDGFQQTGGIYIYKHCDGMPGSVMPTLEVIVSEFVKCRGNDAPYLLAQVMRFFAITEHETGVSGFDFKDRYSYLGWGLDTVKHDDIEYLYEIDASTGAIYINGKAAACK